MKALNILILTITIFYGNIIEFDTYEAKFTQSVKNSSNNVIKYKGLIYIDKHANILWKYTSPIKKNVYIHNKTVIIDEPELEQAIISTLNNELNLLNLLNNSIKVNTNTYENSLNDILYTIKLKDETLQSIKYKDHIDNIINITFSNNKKDHVLPKGIFMFTAPSHYDIIRK